MDRNINEKIRKPRRSKGTPLYTYRNYFAFGVLAFGGVCWYLYELWPQAQKLKQSVLEGKFRYSQEHITHINTVAAGLQDAGTALAFSRYRLKKEEEEDEKVTKQSWLSKTLRSKVDL